MAQILIRDEKMKINLSKSREDNEILGEVCLGREKMLGLNKKRKFIKL